MPGLLSDLPGQPPYTSSGFSRQQSCGWRVLRLGGRCGACDFGEMSAICSRGSAALDCDLLFCKTGGCKGDTQKQKEALEEDVLPASVCALSSALLGQVCPLAASCPFLSIAPNLVTKRAPQCHFEGQLQNWTGLSLLRAQHCA